jgi:hypothetical protein
VGTLERVLRAIRVAVDELACQGDADGHDGQRRKGGEEDAELDPSALAADVARQERRLFGVRGGHRSKWSGGQRKVGGSDD